jgi:hypothetical protein
MRIPISSCFDGKKLKDLLPIPKEVTEYVLISEHLNLKGGNLAGITKSGPSASGVLKFPNRRTVARLCCHP